MRVFHVIYKYRFSFLPVYQLIQNNISCSFIPLTTASKFTRSMSQKSITSFFKITPKKLSEISEDKLQNEVSKTNGQTSPVVEEKEKRSTKRQRVGSSDSESPKSTKSSPVQDSGKKKKVKRQRIESSGSEEDLSQVKITNQIIKEENSVKSPTTVKTPKKRKIKESPSPPEEKNKNLKQKTPSPKVLKVKEELNSPKSLEKDIALNKSEKGDKKIKKSVKKENIDANENEASDNEQITKIPDTEYNPMKPKYHPVKDACWAKGEAVPYLALAKTLEAIEATSARLKMIEILSNYFRSVIALTPDDLLPSVYMSLNQLAPAYRGLELGVAETYLMKAVGQSTGRSVAQVRAAAVKAGDLGAAAAAARATQRTMFAQPPLSARRVFAALREIAAMSGHASVNKKIAKIQSLFTACRNCEAKYLIRSLEGKLRIGLAEQSALQALALAATLTPPEAQAGARPVTDASAGVPPDQFKKLLEARTLTLKTTYCECPDYEEVVGALLRYGLGELPRHCRLRAGRPLRPMLAHPSRAVADVFNRFESEQFTCEWKYDGERAQIHVPEVDGRPDFSKAAVFSRNQEDNTSKYPDVVARLPALLGAAVSSCVLDCEAVAYDPAKDRILPFQVLSTRKRKDAVEAELKVQVCVFVFDLLLLDGRPLVGQPLAERRRLLRENFREVPGQWRFATSRDCATAEEVAQFLEEAVRGSCEGLMVKTLSGEHARYDIARRSRNWLKLKKDYLEGVGDTVDAVVIGAYFGRGKRAGLYGGFLLACYDPGADEYQALCKIGTGFSDEDLQNLTKDLKTIVIDEPRSYYRFDPSHSADAWVSASRVWEVRCADLSLSPAHRAAAGLVDPARGVSLRFPRFVRVRDDKRPEQATTAQQIADMYLAQDQVRDRQPRTDFADDFY